MSVKKNFKLLLKTIKSPGVADDKDFEHFNTEIYERERTQTIYSSPFEVPRTSSDTSSGSAHSSGNETLLDLTTPSSDYGNQSTDYDDTTNISYRPRKNSHVTEKRRNNTWHPARRSLDSRCDGNCKVTIGEQQRTIIHQAVENMKLTEKIAKLEQELKKRQSSEECLNNIQEFFKAHSSKISRHPHIKPIRKAKSENLNDEYFEWLDKANRANKDRRQKADTIKRRQATKGRPSLIDHFPPELTQMTNIKMKLSGQITNRDDIYKVFRQFHPNPEPFLADLRQKQESLTEKFHIVFNELTKLGTKHFNPDTLRDYFVTNGDQRFVDIIDLCVVPETNDALTTAEMNNEV